MSVVAAERLNTRRSLRKTGRVFGIAILTVVALFAVLGPWLIAADPTAQDLANVLVPPGTRFFLGSDHLGRSLLARLAYASRLSLGLAVISVAFAAAPGSVLGMLAAWRGGWLERVLAFVADAVLAMPPLLLVLLLVAFAPGHPWPFYVGLSTTLWVEYFRVVSAKSRVVLASPQVEASRLLGFGANYIVRRHLWPELKPLVLTLMTFGGATAVLALATAGFVGVGLMPPTAELGVMMSEYFPFYMEAPWLIGAPIALLMAIIGGVALVSRRGAAL